MPNESSLKVWCSLLSAFLLFVALSTLFVNTIVSPPVCCGVCTPLWLTQVFNQALHHQCTCVGYVRFGPVSKVNACGKIDPCPTCRSAHLQPKTLHICWNSSNWNNVPFPYPGLTAGGGLFVCLSQSITKYFLPKSSRYFPRQQIFHKFESNIYIDFLLHPFTVVFKVLSDVGLTSSSFRSVQKCLLRTSFDAHFICKISLPSL